MRFYHNGGFYDDSINERIPDGALAIATEKYEELFQAQANGMIIVPDENGYPVAVAPPDPTLAEKQAMIVSAVQAHLDTFAQTRNFDSIFTAATYVASTNPQFALEGRYALEARDATWAKCYEILNAFLAGDIAEPTLQEIMAQLPILEWPVVTNE